MYPLDESIKNLANEILEVIGSNLSKDELWIKILLLLLLLLL
jgi:hypothetical protein